MGLQTDIIFTRALQSNSALMEQLPAGDVYNTSIPLPDEELDNAPIPFIIVAFDGLTNDQSTKDGYEGFYDSVTISVDVVAKTRKQLGELTEEVRSTIREYFENIEETDELFDLIPNDYQFSASGVQYDWEKPCYFQTLSWQCDVNV